MQINYVKKEELFPAFGMCYPEIELILIREDLPKITRSFLIAHEKYHLTDKELNWFLERNESKYLCRYKASNRIFSNCVNEPFPRQIKVLLGKNKKGKIIKNEN